MSLRSRPLTLLAGSAAVLAGLAAVPGAAQGAPVDTAPTASAPGTLDPGTLDPGMRAALERDLGLAADELDARLATEAAAPVTEQRLRAGLGSAYAGAWIPDGATRLTVAVTDEAMAPRVRAAGADVRVVERSERDLVVDQRRLDRRAAAAPDAVRSWRVDPATNAVVVTAARGGAAEARRFARESGAGAVRVETLAATPRVAYDTRGGDQYVINGNTLCSVGFPVAGGFVTAGHCGGTGSPTLGYNNVAQGTFAGSSFPGNDYAWVQTNGSWVSQPWVNDYAGGNVTVSGSQEAAIGASICRSGRTTQWRCGTLQGKNESVNYSGAVVTGLHRTNACANPGDSGGSVLSGNQAQGVTSGIAGGCESGSPQTWYQPVNEILQAYGLSLTTAGGGGGGGALVSSYNGKCIDVPNSNFSDGVRLQMWGCNGSGAQQFQLVDGTLRTGNGTCVDIAGGGTGDRTPIQIANCSTNPAQQWVLSGAGDLVNPQAGKCIDIDAWNPNDGAVLVLWPCTGGSNQKWHR